jgi:hypothetical protein
MLLMRNRSRLSVAKRFGIRFALASAMSLVPSIGPYAQSAGAAPIFAHQGGHLRPVPVATEIVPPGFFLRREPSAEWWDDQVSEVWEGVKQRRLLVTSTGARHVCSSPDVSLTALKNGVSISKPDAGLYETLFGDRNWLINVIPDRKWRDSKLMVAARCDRDQVLVSSAGFTASEFDALWKDPSLGRRLIMTDWASGKDPTYEYHWYDHRDGRGFRIAYKHDRRIEAGLLVHAKERIKVRGHTAKVERGSYVQISWIEQPNLLVTLASEKVDVPALAKIAESIRIDQKSLASPEPTDSITTRVG